MIAFTFLVGTLTLKIMHLVQVFLQLCKNYIPDPKISPFHLSNPDSQFGPIVLRHITYINQNLYASLLIFNGKGA